MKATKLLVAGVAIMSAGFGLSGNVGAADIDAADSTAEVTVEAGELSLTRVPHLQFGKINVADIVDATAPVVKQLETGIVTPATTQDQATANLEAIVTDFRGATTGGWTLSAVMTPFKMVGNPTAAIVDATIHLTPSILGGPVTIGATSTPVVTPADDEGAGTNRIAFAADSGNYLSIPIQQQNVPAGVYQSVLTWTLSDVVTTP